MPTRAECNKILIATGTRLLQGRGLTYRTWPDIGWVYRPSSALQLNLSFQGLSAGGNWYEVWTWFHRWDLGRAIAAITGRPSDVEYDSFMCGGTAFDTIPKFGIGDLQDESLFPGGVDYPVEERFAGFFEYFIAHVLPWCDAHARLERWIDVHPTVRPDQIGAAYYAVGRFLLGSPADRDDILRAYPNFEPKYFEEEADWLRTASGQLTLSQLLDRLLKSSPGDYGLDGVTDWKPPPIIRSRPRKKK